MSKQNRGWFLEPRNGRKIFWGLFAACALLALSDLLYHKEAHFRWETWFDFQHNGDSFKNPSPNVVVTHSRSFSHQQQVAVSCHFVKDAFISTLLKVG